MPAKWCDDDKTHTATCGIQISRLSFVQQQSVSKLDDNLMSMADYIARTDTKRNTIWNGIYERLRMLDYRNSDTETDFETRKTVI